MASHGESRPLDFADQGDRTQPGEEKKSSSDSRIRGKGASQAVLATKSQTVQESKRQYGKFGPADACKSDNFDMIVCSQQSLPTHTKGERERKGKRRKPKRKHGIRENQR
jgi:hypothetical protein